MLHDEDKEHMENFEQEAESKKETQSPEQKETPETKLLPEKKEEPNSSNSLFDELSKDTDKDKEKDTKVKSSDEELFTVQKESDKPSGGIDFDNHKLVAKMTIAAVNVSMGMILQLVSGDWTEDGEKRYSMSEKRKAELLEPLEAVLAASKKKYNPMAILIVTILLTYVPMTIHAVKQRMEKTKVKKLKKLKVLTSDEAKLVDKHDGETEDTDHEDIEQKKLESKDKQIEKPAEKVKAEDITNQIAARIKSIKGKRGARTAEDRKFMETFGL